MDESASSVAARNADSIPLAGAAGAFGAPAEVTRLASANRELQCRGAHSRLGSLRFGSETA